MSEERPTKGGWADCIPDGSRSSAGDGRRLHVRRSWVTSGRPWSRARGFSRDPWGRAGRGGLTEAMAGCATAGPLDDGAAAREKPCREGEKRMTDSGRSVRISAAIGRDATGATGVKRAESVVRERFDPSGGIPGARARATVAASPRPAGSRVAKNHESRLSEFFSGSDCGAKPGPVRQRGACPPLARIPARSSARRVERRRGGGLGAVGAPKPVANPPRRA